jgi:hypothetical protein
VVGAQNYDVEYTITMTLRSVPARATYTFDPPDGGGSFDTSFSAVPEPSTSTLLALGVLILCACGHWQQKRLSRAESM